MILVKLTIRHLCFTSPGLMFVCLLLIGMKNRGKKGFVKAALYDGECVKRGSLTEMFHNLFDYNLFTLILITGSVA